MTGLSTVTAPESPSLRPLAGIASGGLFSLLGCEFFGLGDRLGRWRGQARLPALPVDRFDRGGSGGVFFWWCRGYGGWAGGHSTCWPWAVAVRWYCRPPRRAAGLAGG